MDVTEKLKILSDAAKYDVSCSSSGSNRKNKGGLGQATEAGVCHSWSDDGRCISLLKILLTNHCIYDCAYCVNRSSEDRVRVAFTPREVAELTVNFYKRNYIEGLFLSSGVVKSPDHTMDLLIQVAELLRYEYQFHGYIHMKAIPGASQGMIQALGLLIDRMSINIELPTEASLKLLAPEKDFGAIEAPMRSVQMGMIQNREERAVFRKTPKFVPAGQTTQMIVGAARETDDVVLGRAQHLYDQFQLKRVYYSNYVPVVHSPLTAGIGAAPLMREHRIYQADWLLRFYGFRAEELFTEKQRDLDLEIDPKAQWAAHHLHLFPMEVNRARYEDLLKIPGIGRTYAQRIVKARRFCRLTYDDMEKLKINLKKARHFITVNGVYRGGKIRDEADAKDLVRTGVATKYRQMSMEDLL